MREVKELGEVREMGEVVLGEVVGEVREMGEVVLGEVVGEVVADGISSSSRDSPCVSLHGHAITDSTATVTGR